MLISVIFSFRNEEKVIPVLVDRLMLMMENFSEQLYEYELIFVNDASTDRSLETLLALREKNTQIKIINMSRSYGVTH